MPIKHLNHESTIKLEENGFIKGTLMSNLTLSLGMVLKRRNLEDIRVMLGGFMGVEEIGIGKM